MTTTATMTVRRRLRELISVRLVILIGLAAIGAIGFAWLAHEMLEGEFDALERSILLGIHQLDTPAGDVVMRAASFVGAGLGLVIAIAITAIWLIRRGHSRTAMILIVHAVVAQGVSMMFKLIFARDRPTLFDEIELPSSYSFPSGHSLLSFAVYGAIAAIIVRDAPRLRWVVIPATVVLVLLIGLSRMYLGVHWPLDVIGGYAAAVPPLAVFLYLLHRLKVMPPGTPLA